MVFSIQVNSLEVRPLHIILIQILLNVWIILPSQIVEAKDMFIIILPVVMEIRYVSKNLLLYHVI